MANRLDPPNGTLENMPKIVSDTSTSSPKFILHLCDTLNLAGIRGFNSSLIAPEHFRLAKKNDPSVSAIFWPALHDVIVLLELPHILGNHKILESAWKIVYSR